MRILFYLPDDQNELLYKTSIERMLHSVTFLNGEQFDFDFLEVYDFDLLILNLSQFHLDRTKLSLIAKCRALCPKTAILILTADTASDIRWIALEQGADDCLIEATNLKEFEVVIKSLHRRIGRDGSSNSLDKGLMKLNPNMCSVEIEGQFIKLTRKEYILLKLLMERIGRIVPTECIESHLFELNASSGAHLVHPHISRLRAKTRHPEINIKAEYGIGYILEVRANHI